MPLPPLISTPRIAGFPAVPLPAPPGPVVVETPPEAFGSAPCPVPFLAAPEPEPFIALPGPGPRPIPDPPPVPPTPVLSPPVGAIARDPFANPGGRPTLVPGWLETIAPASLPAPAAFGGVVVDPTSDGVPSPTPVRLVPEPDVADPDPMEGGGGTMFVARRVPSLTPALPPVLPEPPPGPESEGGGGTTLGLPR